MRGIPHLKSLVERHKDAKFSVIGVNTDRDPDVFREKRKEHGVNWRSAFEGSTGGPIPTRYGVRGYPTLIVIDHEGVIRKITHSPADVDDLVDELLAKIDAQ